MLLNWHPVTRLKFPGRKDSPREYFAQIVIRSKVGNDEIAEYINNTSSYSKADVVGMLAALPDAIGWHLEHGDQVTIDNLETFYPTVKSKGSAPTIAELDRIPKRVGVITRLSRKFLMRFTRAHFSRVD